MKTKRTIESAGYTKMDSSPRSRFRIRTPRTHPDCLAETKIVKWRTFRGTLLVLLPGCTPLPASALTDTQALADSSADPLFISATVEPNIFLILDNSGSMNEFACKEVLV